MQSYLVGGFFCAAFCADTVYIYQPIDVTRAGQSVKTDFTLKKPGYSEFSIHFETGKDFREMLRRSTLFGDINNEGVAIPVSLQLIKDGKIYYQRKINTVGHSAGQSLYYKYRNVNTSVRQIKVLELPPGRYSAVITTLEDVQDFDGVKAFLGFSLNK